MTASDARPRWLADEPLRLLPLYPDPPRPAVTASRPGAVKERTVILRAGGVDARRIGAAAEVLRGVSALAVNLTERRATIRSISQAARRHGLALIGDPALHRMALPGYAATPGLRRLRYRPTDGGGPWRASDLHEHANAIARGVIEEQHLSEAQALIAASVAVTAPEDPNIAALPELLRGSLAARDAWGQSLPVIAPLILSLRRFSTAEAVLALERVLGELQPEAWLLVLDGPSMKSPARHLLAASALARAMDRRGAPVLIARAGPLRRLWLALGYGVELALGRLERFKLEDHRARPGPGHNPPRWELPELLCSLPQQLAAQAIASGLLSECGCPVCACAGSIEERLEGAVLHNATVVQADIDEVGGRTPCELLERLEARLREARSLSHELEGRGVELRRYLAHLDSWPDACAALRAAGHVPAAARPGLRLGVASGARG